MCDVRHQDTILEVVLLLSTLSTTLHTFRLCCDITQVLPARMLLNVLWACRLLSHRPFADSCPFPCPFSLGPPPILLLPSRMSLQTLSIWLSRCRMTPQGLIPSLRLPRDQSQLLVPYRVNIRGLSQPLCLLVRPVQQLSQGGSTTAAHPPPLSGPLHRCAHPILLTQQDTFLQYAWRLTLYCMCFQPAGTIATGVSAAHVSQHACLRDRCRTQLQAHFTLKMGHCQSQNMPLKACLFHTPDLQ